MFVGKQGRVIFSLTEFGVLYRRAASCKQRYCFRCKSCCAESNIVSSGVSCAEKAYLSANRDVSVFGREEILGQGSRSPLCLLIPSYTSRPPHLSSTFVSTR